MDHGGTTSSSIELHDSHVAGIALSGDCVIVHLRPAYVHRSEGRPGIDPGSGWVQDLDMVVSEAMLVSRFSKMSRDLDDGSLSVGNEVFENIVPLPIDVRGAVCFSAVSQSERLIIQGTRATVVSIGDARYVEPFPGTR